MKHCPNCNEEITKKSGKFCPKCGASLKDDSKKFSSRNNIILIIVIVVLVAIVALFASGTIQLENDSANANSTNDTATQFIASSKSDKFHIDHGCEWGDKIADSNKIVYSSRQAAVDSGKTPCGVCNP